MKLQDFQFKIDESRLQTFDIPLKYFVAKIDEFIREDNLDVNPDFQRGRVWTTKQQELFCEFVLRRGLTPRLLFNHPGWLTDFSGQMVCVDGLQRITALQLMLSNRLRVFGSWLSAFDDQDKFLRSISIPIGIKMLQSRAEVLQWYLQVNSTGTPHTIDEIDRVKKLLEKEVTV